MIDDFVNSVHDAINSKSVMGVDVEYKTLAAHLNFIPNDVDEGKEKIIVYYEDQYICFDVDSMEYDSDEDEYWMECGDGTTTIIFY